MFTMDNGKKQHIAITWIIETKH